MDRMPALKDHPAPLGSVLVQHVVRVSGHSRSTVDEELAIEEPLEIQLGYGDHEHRQVKSISVTMRTPGDDIALAVGFLLTEGVLEDAADIEQIRHVEPEPRKADGDAAPIDAGRQNIVRVDLQPDVQVRTASLERNFYTTSSCGICGKASLLALRSVCPPRRENTLHMEAEMIYALPDRLREAQQLFSKTGGLHGAGLFRQDGQLVAVHEDVGRHNAVDKLVGGAFLRDETPLRDSILMLSGRASFELMQKALMAGIPLVAAVGAPSSLALQVARDFDITLIGFLRNDHFNIYHGAERITGCEERRASR